MRRIWLPVWAHRAENQVSGELYGQNSKMEGPMISMGCISNFSIKIDHSRFGD